MSSTKIKKFYIGAGLFILAILIANIGYANTSSAFNGNIGTSNIFYTPGNVSITATNNRLEATITHRLFNTDRASRTAQVTPQRRNSNGTWSNAGNAHLFSSRPTQQTFLRIWTPAQLSGAGTYRLSFNANAGLGTINIGGSFHSRR